MIERNLRRVWEQLRSAKGQRRDFLERVRIRGLRGISDQPTSGEQCNECKAKQANGTCS